MILPCMKAVISTSSPYRRTLTINRHSSFQRRRLVQSTKELCCPQSKSSKCQLPEGCPTLSSIFQQQQQQQQQQPDTSPCVGAGGALSTIFREKIRTVVDSAAAQPMPDFSHSPTSTVMNHESSTNVSN